MDGNFMTSKIAPSKEPIIRVGIILPADNIKNIELVLSESDSFEIETNEKIYPSCKNNSNITISLNDEKMRINELGVITKKIVINPTIDSSKNFSMIKEVVAGRGFHWEKVVDIKYWGSLEFVIIENNIMVINELKLEDYLKCVATSEMSQYCPKEFLISQTIVARSWLLASSEQKHESQGFDVCNDDCCQRYQGMDNCTIESIEAANQSHGKVLIFDNSICDTRYSKSCGGKTENYENVWSGKPVPYLISINDCDEQGVNYCNPSQFPEKSITRFIGSVDEDLEYYHWNHEVKNQSIIKHLKNYYDTYAKAIVNIIALEIGKSGRIYNLDVIYIDQENKEKSLIVESEYKIRDLLSDSFLFSSAFTIEKKEQGFNLNGKGWGHGVGLCQIGALSMALSGKNSNQILSHYYPGTEIINIY